MTGGRDTVGSGVRETDEGREPLVLGAVEGAGYSASIPGRRWRLGFWWVTCRRSMGGQRR